MQEILSARSPYGLIKEADALINTVNAVNSSLLTGRRTQAIAKIDAHIATLNKDMATAQGEASLRAACLKPLEALREQVQKEESLAHITQAEAEAVKEFDAAVGRIEEFLRKLAEQKKPKDDGSGKVPPPPPVVKKQRIVKPADIVKTTYLETSDDVNGFLDALRQELEQGHRQQRTHPDSVSDGGSRNPMNGFAMPHRTSDASARTSESTELPTSTRLRRTATRDVRNWSVALKQAFLRESHDRRLRFVARNRMALLRHCLPQPRQIVLESRLSTGDAFGTRRSSTSIAR